MYVHSPGSTFVNDWMLPDCDLDPAIDRSDTCYMQPVLNQVINCVRFNATLASSSLHVSSQLLTWPDIYVSQ